MPVSETFYSIQGEGPTAGTPAVFLRLAGCNLTCPGWGTTGCDTTAVWRKVWRILDRDGLYEHWAEQGWLRHLNPPNPSHLIITGGEPLLHQHKLTEFLRPLMCPVEVETNGTIIPQAFIDGYVTHYNVSPKLRSSGNEFKKAYIPESLYWFSRDKRAAFKFVVQRHTLAEDWAEIKRLYIRSFRLLRKQIWLMPEGADRDSWIRNADPVAELCKEEGVHFSPRLQLILYDQPTGV